MHDSLEQFLGQVAHRGSWVGGGSVAALSAALAAALLEKLVADPRAARQLARRRRACLILIEQDAKRFARVIEATRTKRHGVFARALKDATEVPCQVYEHAGAVLVACRRARRGIKPKFQSDLKCAMAVASSAQASARALIQTNLTWLNDGSYTKRLQQRLRAAASPHVG